MKEKKTNERTGTPSLPYAKGAKKKAETKPKGGVGKFAEKKKAVTTSSGHDPLWGGKTKPPTKKKEIVEIK